MRIVYIWITFFIIILFFSCKNKIDQSSIPIISPEYFKEMDFSISYFAEDIYYIPLDLKVLLPHITEIECFDNSFVVSTFDSGVFVYSQDGKLIREIGKKGNAQGEFMYCANLSVDRIHKRIYIRANNKLLVFDDEGNFIREFKGSQDYSRIYYNDNYLYGLNTIISGGGYQPSNWFVYDTLKNKLYEKINSTTGFRKGRHIGLGLSVSYYYNNRLQYWNNYNDTIFELNGITCKPKYLFKKDYYRITPDYISSMKTVSDVKNIGCDNIYSLLYVFESNKSLYLRFKQYGKYNLCLYDKQKSIFFNNTIGKDQSKGVINDIDGGLSVMPRLYRIVNNEEYVIKIIDVIDLKEHVESEKFKISQPKFPEKKKALINLVDSLSENDNPVLMLIKLKQ